jgi:hypothetical protein
LLCRRGPAGEGKFLAIAAGPDIACEVHGEAGESGSGRVDARGSALAAGQGCEQTEKQTDQSAAGAVVRR